MATMRAELERNEACSTPASQNGSIPWACPSSSLQTEADPAELECGKQLLRDSKERMVGLGVRVCGWVCGCVGV